MSDVSILTTEEVHRIAYLTMHGWEYCPGSYGGWRKDGFACVRHDRHGSEYGEPIHELAEAYFAQLEGLV